MDIRKTGQTTGDNRSPTLEKLKRRKEDRQRSSSSPNTSIRSLTDDKKVSAAVPDPSVVPIEISGNLHKQGRLLKKWKPRFFQVQGNNLYYYQNYEKKECLGLIDLQKCYYIGKSNAASFGFAMELQTWGRTHLLAARDEREAERWIKVIKKKMVPEARERDKKGTKTDVSAIIPDQDRTRRATIKMNRSGRRPTVIPSASAQEMSLKSLQEAEDEEDIDSVQSNRSKPQHHVTSSQSNPEFRSYQTNNISTSTGNTIIQEKRTTPHEHSSSSIGTTNIQNEKNKMTSSPTKLLSMPQTQPTAIPASVTQSIAEIDLPPPLDTPPVLPRTSSSSAPIVPPTTLAPSITEQTTSINYTNETHQPSSQQTSKRSLTKTVSVEDIILPPPPSLVPIIKRSSTVSGYQPSHHINNLSMVDLPPPIDFSNTGNTPFESKTSATNILPLPAPTTTEWALSKSGVSSSSIASMELPPPPSDLFDLPPPLMIPDKSLPAASSVPENNRPTIDMQVLKDKIPPMDPTINNIPSAIDQLKYLLSKDDSIQLYGGIYTTNEYALLPEMVKPWLTEETGIEQLRSFLHLVECKN